VHAFVFALALCVCAAIAVADGGPSSNIYGALGLNTVPSARMDPAGTIRAGTSSLDPYIHGFIGFQVMEPLSVTLRQTAQASGINDDPDRFYPGLDLKLRLKEESRYAPQIALGLQSAFGHRKMASEYIAFSKRWHGFDFTGGAAWGRMGGKGHLSNPFKKLSGHFDSDRDGDSEKSSSPTDWFTGEKIGFFGGVEYFTDIKGLSFKADWNADRYEGERALPGFDAPESWSAGLNYTPWDWGSLSAGIVGTDRIFARLSFQENMARWAGRSAPDSDPVPLHFPRREKGDPVRLENPSKDESVRLSHAREEEGEASAHLHLSPFHASGRQVGRGARHLANHSGKGVERLTLTPRVLSLRGPSIHLSRRDMEAALAHNNGSPEETWQDTAFSDVAAKTDPLFKNGFKGFVDRVARGIHNTRFILDTQTSVMEEEAGALYRTSLIAEDTMQLPFGFALGAGTRINIASNLDNLAPYRGISAKPVRSDVAAFASNAVTAERAYLSWLHSINSDFHLALTAGLLEEMFAGQGGEILYRPFGKTFAVGAEGWEVYKRDPASDLAMDFSEDGTFTGHLNFYYEPPLTDLTFHIKAGRFLGGDNGVGGEVRNRFDNGATLSGFLTATNGSDPDAFGGDLGLYGGMRLTLPLGNIPYVPQGTLARVETAPLARDSGQTLQPPLPLYDMTDPFSYRALNRSWGEILE